MMKLKIYNRLNISGGPKKQKQLNGNSYSTAFVFLDHPVIVIWAGDGTEVGEGGNRSRMRCGCIMDWE